jgi:hypothetical protein
MSTCISRHGEYGSHELTATGADRFVCQRCFVLDEDGILNALDDAESRLAAALARIEAVNDEATYDDVYSEISLALGVDDSADESVDFKRDLTERILRHFRAALAAPAATPGPTEETCHNGHPFAPGIDTDMEAEGRSPDPRWCNVCGETRRPGVAATPEPTEATQAPTCEHGWTQPHNQPIAPKRGVMVEWLRRPGPGVAATPDKPDEPAT